MQSAVVSITGSSAEPNDYPCGNLCSTQVNSRAAPPLEHLRHGVHADDSGGDCQANYG